MNKGIVWNTIRQGVLRYPVVAVVFGTIMVYLLSWMGYYTPLFGVLMLVAGSILFARLAWYRLDIALGIVLIELMLGSQGGSLFTLREPLRITLRMLFWAVLMIVGTIRVYQQRFDVRKMLAHSFVLAPLIGLGIGVGWGIVWGAVNHQPLLYSDANGYLYYGLLVPIIAICAQKKTDLTQINTIIRWGYIGMAIFQILFFLFSAWVISFDWYAILYYWLRDFRIVEIGKLLGSVLVRMFVQSQLYAVIALGLFFPVWWRNTQLTRMQWVISVCSVSLVIMSLSRSLWVAAFVMTAVFMISQRVWRSWHSAARWIIRGVGITALSVAMLSLSTAGGLIGVAQGLGVRSSFSLEEPAIRSRWELLPKMVDAIFQSPWVGYGFGKTITYQSSDPKLVARGIGGQFTTASFEWGYLDVLVKLGLIGTICILFFFVKIWWFGRQVWVLADKQGLPCSQLALGAWLGYTALLVTHMFTPYLNHPLGIGFVVMYTGWLLHVEQEMKYEVIHSDT